MNRKGTLFGIGTHIARPRIEEVLRYAISRGLTTIDTAPAYGDGLAHNAIAQVIISCRQDQKRHTHGITLFSKAGFLPSHVMRQIDAGQSLLGLELLIGNHLLSPELIRLQAARTVEQFKGHPIAGLLLHNPEVQVRKIGVRRTKANLRRCFEACEVVVSELPILGYGIASWGELFEYLPVTSLVKLAGKVADGRHNFKFLQLPVSLVKHSAVRDALLRQKGPLREAADAGLYILGSSPLHGGRLPRLLAPGFVQLIGENLSAAQACLHFARSVGLLDMILVGCSDRSHVDEVVSVQERPALEMEEMGKLLGML